MRGAYRSVHAGGAWWGARRSGATQILPWLWIGGRAAATDCGWDNSHVRAHPSLFTPAQTPPLVSPQRSMVRPPRFARPLTRLGCTGHSGPPLPLNPPQGITHLVNCCEPWCLMGPRANDLQYCGFEVRRQPVPPPSSLPPATTRARDSRFSHYLDTNWRPASLHACSASILAPAPEVSLARLSSRSFPFTP